jgi:hypothetical protein
MNNIPVPDEFTKEFLAYICPVLEAEFPAKGKITKDQSSGLVSYISAAKSIDPFELMRRIRIIEQGIKDGKVKLMFEELRKRRLTDHLYQRRLLFRMEFFEIWLLALVANDKAILNDFGLLEFEKRGDLRTARLIEDETEQMFRLLRFEWARKRPMCIQFAQQRVREEMANMNASFFQKLARILKQPGIELKHVCSETQRLLLICWASNIKFSEDKYFLPLCYRSDPAIAEFVTKTLNINQISPGMIRKKWERLGLRKMRHIELRKPV